MSSVIRRLRADVDDVHAPGQHGIDHAPGVSAPSNAGCWSRMKSHSDRQLHLARTKWPGLYLVDASRPAAGPSRHLSPLMRRAALVGKPSRTLECQARTSSRRDRTTPKPYPRFRSADLRIACDEDDGLEASPAPVAIFWLTVEQDAAKCREKATTRTRFMAAFPTFIRLGALTDLASPARPH